MLIRNTFILNVARDMATANNPPNTIKPRFIQNNKLDKKNNPAFDTHAKQLKSLKQPTINKFENI